MLTVDIRAAGFVTFPKRVGTFRGGGILSLLSCSFVVGFLLHITALCPGSGETHTRRERESALYSAVWPGRADHRSMMYTTDYRLQSGLSLALQASR